MKKNFKIIESAGGILRNGNRIVLVLNVRGNFWGFPKGKVENNETPSQTAKREVIEETGVGDISLVEKLGTYERKAADGQSVILRNHIFLFETSEEKLKPLEGEALDAKWVLMNDVEGELSLKDDAKFFESIRSKLL